jgi:hypothetical protein
MNEGVSYTEFMPNPARAWHVSELIHKNITTLKRAYKVKPRNIFICLFGLGSPSPVTMTSSECLRAVELIKYLCASEDIPIENVVGIDDKKEYCDHWSNEGITTLNGDWYHVRTIQQAKDYIYDSSRNPKIIVYTDTYGDKAVEYLYKTIIDSLFPVYFYPLFATRNAWGTKRSILNFVSREFPDYKLQDHFASKDGGLIAYKGIAMVCLELANNNKISIIDNLRSLLKNDRAKAV